MSSDPNPNPQTDHRSTASTVDSPSSTTSSPYTQSQTLSPSTAIHPMMSTATFQSATTMSTVDTSAGGGSTRGRAKRTSFLKKAFGLGRRDSSGSPSSSRRDAAVGAASSSILPLLPGDASVSPIMEQPKETKAEKKERKRREQEASMSPEELRLANLMGRYGAGFGGAPGGSGGGFGGMSMDYASKDRKKSDRE